MNWSDFIKPYVNDVNDIKICESVFIKIEAIDVKGKSLIVYKDPNCVLFKKQYTESKRFILKEQKQFELMMGYRKTAQLILKNIYQ